MNDQTPDIPTDPWDKVRRFDVDDYDGPVTDGPDGEYMLASEVDAARAHAEAQYRTSMARLGDHAVQVMKENTQLKASLEAAFDAAIADRDDALAQLDAAQQEAEGQRGLWLSCEDMAQQEVERWKQEAQTLREALTSIANSACRECCQEAALVARAALAPRPPEPQ